MVEHREGSAGTDNRKLNGIFDRDWSASIAGNTPEETEQAGCKYLLIDDNDVGTKRALKVAN